MLREQAY